MRKVGETNPRAYWSSSSSAESETAYLDNQTMTELSSKQPTIDFVSPTPKGDGSCTSYMSFSIKRHSSE